MEWFFRSSRHQWTHVFFRQKKNIGRHTAINTTSHYELLSQRSKEQRIQTLSTAFSAQPRKQKRSCLRKVEGGDPIPEWTAISSWSFKQLLRGSSLFFWWFLSPILGFSNLVYRPFWDDAIFFSRGSLIHQSKQCHWKSTAKPWQPTSSQFSGGATILNQAVPKFDQLLA